jgi:hypothetical protein
VTGAPLADAVREALAFEPQAERSGNLTIGRGSLDARPVRAAFVENHVASGSLGALECERLATLFAVCARERSALVLFLDSAGAKLSEGLKALGAFRKLYRAGLDAVFAGVPVAALLGKNCFGGSSMLAHLARGRLFDTTTQLAMSGPSILATAAGTTVMDEMFRAMADAALSAAARAKASSANRIWTRGEELRPWLREALAPGGDASSALRMRHEALIVRLPKQPSAALPEAVRRRDLEKIYAQGYEANEMNGVLSGSGRRDGAEETFAGIVGKSPLGAHRAWHFADIVWRLAAKPPARLEVLLDCATHAARLDDERIVLSEFIVDMAFALAAAAAAGARVGLTVVGKASGGVYVALAAPAARVTSVYGVDIQVLPGTAVAAILGKSREEAPAFADYRASGVADEELKLGFVPKAP